MTKRDILSDADVEVLFETKPISDIKQFNHELEKDIDKSRYKLQQIYRKFHAHFLLVLQLNKRIFSSIYTFLNRY